MSGIDESVLNTLYALRDPAVVQFFIWISETGSTIVIGGIASAVGLYLIARRHITDLAGLAVSIVGTTVVVFALKEVIARARPDTVYQAYLENSPAFPSGHAALSLALYGFLAYLAWKYIPEKQRLTALVVATLLIGLIGFSRLYLGLHFVSDVLAGYVVGAVFLTLGMYLSERLKHHPIWS